MSAFFSAIELSAALLTFFYFPKIKAAWGWQPALAAAAAGAVLVDQSQGERVRALFQAWRDSRFARALSLFTLLTFVFLLIRLLFDEAGTFFAAHWKVFHLTPGLVAAAYCVSAGRWKPIGWILWLIVFTFLWRETSSGASAQVSIASAEESITRFVYGREIILKNDCSAPIRVEITPMKIFGPGRPAVYVIAPGESSYLDDDDQRLRSRDKFTYRFGYDAPGMTMTNPIRFGFEAEDKLDFAIVRFAASGSACRSL